MKDIPYTDPEGITYTYGDFFPPTFSPFAYNETVAEEYQKLEKSEALKKGFTWKEQEKKTYIPTIQAEHIPDTIHEVDDTITKEVIQCTHKGMCADQCTTAFKITAAEFALYKRLNIPLPSLCFNCRHGERTHMRNPRALWTRTCMCVNTNHSHASVCTNTFETSYAPQRSETVYCETCYQQEVA